MKKLILPLIAAITAFLPSCEKASLEPASVNSVNISDARRESMVITFEQTGRGFQYTAIITNGDGLNLGTGDLIYDSCLYVSPIKSKGKIRIDGNTVKPDGTVSYWKMVIEEIRSEAALSAGTHPYYLNYYSSPVIFDDSGNAIIAGTAGPFYDSSYSGKGVWKIISSTHPVIKTAGGSLSFSEFDYYNYLPFTVYPTIDEIVKYTSPNSVLYGKFKL